MKIRQLQAGGIVLALVASLIPSFTFAGGSSFSISELNPQTRTLKAGENNQLLKELKVSLYYEAIPSITNIEFDVTCDSGNSFKKISVGQGTTTLGSTEFMPPQTFANGTEITTGPATAHVKAEGSVIKYKEDQTYWVKVDLDDSDKTEAQVCKLSNFTFKDGANDEIYGAERSYEEVAAEITPVVVLESTGKTAIKDALSVAMKKLGALEYKLGSTNQLIYSADLKTTQDITVDDVLFSCQDSGSLAKLKLKDQTARKVLNETVPSENFAPYENLTYASPIQSAFFQRLNWEIPANTTKTMSILGDFVTNGWAVGYDRGCSVMAINAHTKDGTSIHPTAVPGIGLKYQTSPLNISNEFLDIHKDDSLYTVVMYLKNNYIVDGYDNGMFMPQNKINRAEFIKMIVNAKMPGKGGDIYSDACYEPPTTLYPDFPDVISDAWYRFFACYAKKAGIIKGYNDGTFRPGKNVSRAEAIKMALKLINVPNLEEPTDAPWYTPYIQPAKTLGLLTNDPNLSRPDEEITRGEMATILYKVLNPSYFQPGSELAAKILMLDGQRGDNFVVSHLDSGVLVGDFQLQCTESAFENLDYTMALIYLSDAEKQAMGETTSSMTSIVGPDLSQWLEQEPILAPLYIFRFNPMHVAANSGCVDITENYLDTDSSKLNDPTGYSGKTPLVVAVDNQDEAMVDMLLDHGADPDQLTIAGATKSGLLIMPSSWAGLSPLYFAIIHNNTTIAQKLLDAGADPNEILSNTQTVLDIADYLSTQETRNFLILHGAKNAADLDL